MIFISLCFISITKMFLYEKNIDIVCIYGNDTIRDYTSPYDSSDIYLQNHFYLRWVIIYLKILRIRIINKSYTMI